MPPGFISALQLLVVVASDWTSNGAYLGRYERPGAAAPWVPAGSPLAVSLGRGGLAWGRAFLIPGISPGPIKREGDGCSPAGAFPITALFGVSAPAAGAKLPWLKATPDLKCVDDPDSWHYNRIVDRNSVDRIDWQSCEDMLRTDGRYEVGAVVGCNDDPVEPGAGSCLFLHVWEAHGAPTAGCTALAREDMVTLAGWLDGARSPWLVQLPHAAFVDLREPWRLPEILA